MFKSFLPALIMPFDRVVHLNKQTRQRLIDQHGHKDAQKALDECKRDVEDQKRFTQRVGRRKNGFVKAEDGLHAAEQLCIDQVNEKVI